MSFEKIDNSVYRNNTVFLHESTYGMIGLRVHQHVAYAAQCVKFSKAFAKGDISLIKKGQLIETDNHHPFVGIVEQVLISDEYEDTITIYLKEPWASKDNCLTKPPQGTGFKVKGYTTLAQALKSERLHEYRLTGDLYEYDKMYTDKAFLFNLDGEKFEIGVVELRNLFRKEFNKGETK